MGGREGESKAGKGIRKGNRSPLPANLTPLACIPYQTGAGDRQEPS